MINNIFHPTHLTPHVKSESSLCFMNGDHMRLQDPVPGVLFSPVVIVMFRVNHCSTIYALQFYFTFCNTKTRN